MASGGAADPVRRAGRRHAVARRPERHGDFARRPLPSTSQDSGRSAMEPRRARLRRRRDGRHVRRDDARDRALAAACASASTSAGRRSRRSSSTTTAASRSASGDATPRGDYDGTIDAIAGLVEEARALDRGALQRRHRHARRDLAGDRRREERQLDVAERPAAARRSRGAARAAGSSGQRRQLLRAVGSERRRRRRRRSRSSA